MVNLLNISEKYKAFVWTPASTASKLAWKIFENYEFSSFDIKDGGKLYKKKFCHGHFIHLPENHNEYDLILTCRNPYNRVTAGFDRPDSQKIVEKNLQLYYESEYHKTFVSLLKERKPNYFIRVENIYEDYSKIPFIINSEFFQSGKMKELIYNNKFKNKIYKHRANLNEDLAELIYQKESYYFELLGYDKNSWKI